jgi:hypothetical protein
MNPEDRDNWSGPMYTSPEQRTRTEDPVTSLLAAADVNLREQYVEILDKLRRRRYHPPCTYHELIPANSAGRITELHRAGLIESVGMSTVKGKRGRLWRITTKGLDAIR